MKTKLFDALQTKFLGVDAQLLDGIADKLAKTIASEDEVATAIEGVTFQQVLESYGDRRANQAQKTAVLNYEKKYGIKDGKVVEETKPTPKPEPKPDDATAAMMKQIEELNNRLNAINAANVAKTRGERLDEVLKDAPDSIKSMYKTNFVNMNFADDAQFDSWLDTNKTTIEALTNDFKAKGAISTPPKGGKQTRGTDEPDPLVLARAERIAKEAAEAPSAITGLK